MLANQSCRIRSLIHRQGVAVMVCPYLPWLGRSRSQRERKCLRHGLVSRLRKSLSWSEQRCPLWVLIVPFYHYEWVLFLSRFPGRPFCEHGRVIPENRPKSILYVYLSLLLVKLSTERVFLGYKIDRESILGSIIDSHTLLRRNSVENRPGLETPFGTFRFCSHGSYRCPALERILGEIDVFSWMCSLLPKQRD